MKEQKDATPNATSVARMKQAGGILLAKTNLPELSYWIESDNRLSGRSNNLKDLTRTPGGPNGGGSAAIADILAIGCITFVDNICRLTPRSRFFIKWNIDKLKYVIIFVALKLTHEKFSYLFDIPFTFMHCRLQEII